MKQAYLWLVGFLIHCNLVPRIVVYVRMNKLVIYNERSMRTVHSFFIMVLLLCSASSQAERILQTVDGDDIALSSFKGKWTFVNYWASWCGPCLNEISALNQFYKNNKDKQVQVYAINYDGLLLSKQKRLIKQFHIRYPSLKRSAGKLLHLGSIEVVPVTFVFNPNGELSTTLYGGQTLESLTKAMSKADSTPILLDSSYEMERQ